MLVTCVVCADVVDEPEYYALFGGNVDVVK